ETRPATPLVVPSAPAFLRKREPPRITGRFRPARVPQMAGLGSQVRSGEVAPNVGVDRPRFAAVIDISAVGLADMTGDRGAVESADKVNGGAARPLEPLPGIGQAV